MRRPICERCGWDMPAAEITTYGDREPQWVATANCTCPAPSCPFSHGRLDHNGRCTDQECFMWHEVVPIPELG